MKYLVERCQGAGCSVFTQITTPTGTTYSDTGLAAGTSYTYQVRAVDAAGNLSQYSAPASATTQSIPPPPTGARGAYAFSEGNGTTASDASGNGNNGTLSGGATWTLSGKYGSAISLNGVNGFIAVPASPTLNLGSAGTIEGWVKVNVLGRWHSLLAKGAANSDAVHNYALEITDQNVFRCILGDGASFMMVDSTIRAVAAQFTHAACAWDGTTVRLYINGALNSSRPQTLTPAANTAQLYLGQFGGNADRLQGTLDEVRIYARALTDAELQTDMNTPIGGTP